MTEKQTVIGSTKPSVLMTKYRSLLLSSIISETTAFLVSLIDTFVAGNALGKDALAAIGLMAPLFSVATLLTSIINSGTVLNYTRQIGVPDIRRANEYFSEGLILGTLTGTLYTVLLIVFKGPILSYFNITEGIRGYANGYYDIVVFYFMLLPISFILENTIISDGGEKLISFVNVIQIISNVILSYYFSLKWGTQGIAIATVLCKAGFVLIICVWFLGKKNTIRFKALLKAHDCKAIMTSGVVKASSYGFTAVTTYALNMIVLNYYDIDTFDLLVIVEKLMGTTTIFIGLAMAIQPFIGALLGEGNTKAMRLLSEYGTNIMVIVGFSTTILFFLFSRFVVIAFIKDDPLLLMPGVMAVRIISSTLVFSSFLVFFFISYFLLNKYYLALIITCLKDLIFPIGLAFAATLLWKTRQALWISIALSPVCTTAICMIIILICYGKTMFPYLIPKTKDDKTYIHSFEITPENAATMGKTAGELMNRENYSKRLQILVETYIEDALMLIKDSNEGLRRRLMAECTLMFEDEGLRLIIRDNGLIYELANDDTSPESLRRFVVDRISQSIDMKNYILATGINRNEYFILKD